MLFTCLAGYPHLHLWWAIFRWNGRRIGGPASRPRVDIRRGAVLVTDWDDKFYVYRQSRRGRAGIRHFLGVASIFRAEAPVKPAAAAHARRQRVVQQLSGAPHGFRRTFARQPSKLRHRGEHDKDHGGPPWGQGSPRIYITTADAAVRLQEQPALEPPARCRADNPRRPAGSGRSCRLPRGPS